MLLAQLEAKVVRLCSSCRVDHPTSGMASSAMRCCALLLLISSASACHPAEKQQPTWTAEVDTLPDAIVVKTTAGRVWGRDRHLVPDLVLGRDGPEDALFGAPEDMALLADGGIAVADGIGPRVLMFSPDGGFPRLVGSPGEGPGEYRRVTGLVGLPDGGVLVHDGRLLRLSRFDSLGHLQSTRRFEPLWQSVRSIAPMAGNRFAVRFFYRRNGFPSRPGYLVFDRALEVIDTVPPSDSAMHYRSTPGALQPRFVQAWHPDGYLIRGSNDGYSLDVMRPHGLPVRIQRDWVPVPVADGEREVEEELRDILIRRGPTIPIPEVPRFKPAFKAIYASRTGEIWVNRHTKAVQLWEQPADIVEAGGRAGSPYWEPLLLDVFDVDGRLLGSVEGPPRTDVLAISSDTVWASVVDRNHVPLVVRFVARPDGS